MRNKKRPTTNPSTRLMTIQEENEKEEKYDIAEAYKGQPVPTFDTADGPFIVTGFRPQLSLLDCLLSMFTCHNQTINIWTSFTLVVFNIGMCIDIRVEIQRDIAFFFWFHGITRTLCWINSWAYHTFVCHSEKNARYLCLLDYIGCYLTPLGMGSAVLFIELYAHQSIAVPFIVTGFLCVTGSIYLALCPEYQTERYRRLRLILSVGSMCPYLLGLVVAVYVRHGCAIPPYYKYLLFAFMWETIGAFFYITMLPEKKYRKTFDCFLSSHNLWHWCNFGFDYYMMHFIYRAYLHLHLIE
jgi:adiponectin receptor